MRPALAVVPLRFLIAVIMPDKHKHILRVSTIACSLTLFFATLQGPAFSNSQETGEPGDKPKLVVQTGHSRRINSLAFSSDGELLVSGGEDNRIILWHVPTGSQLGLFKGHEGSGVYDVAFSPDRRVLAGISETINLWNVRTGVLLRQIANEGGVGELLFAGDGNILVGLNKEDFGDDSGDTFKPFMQRIGQVHFWNAQSGAKLHIGSFTADKVASSPAEPIIALADKYIPDFETVEVGFRDDQQWPPWYRYRFSPRLKLIDLRSGTTVRELVGHNARIKALAFSKDGKLLASSDKDGKVKVWNRVTGRLLFTTSVRPHSVDSLQFDETRNLLGIRSDGAIISMSPNLQKRTVTTKIEGRGILGPDARLVAVTTGKSLELWKPDSKTPFWSASQRGETLAATAFDSRIGRLARATSSGNIGIWKPYKSRHPIMLKGPTHIGSMFFGSSGELVVGNNDEKSVKRSGSEMREYSSQQKCGIPFTFDPDGRLLTMDPFPDWSKSKLFESDTSASPDWGHPTIHVRDAETCKEVSLQAFGERLNRGTMVNRENAISRTGILALAGPSYNIPLIAFGGPPSSYRWFNYHFTEIDYPIRLVSLSDNRVFETLVGKTYGLTGPYEVTPGRVQTLTFNNTGDLLAAGGGYHEKGHVDLWDVKSRTLKKRLEENYEVRFIAFNPQNENELVTAGYGPEISVWSINGTKIRVLRGHTEAVTSVAFSDDGKMIISSSEDNTTKIWDAVNGKELATLVSSGENAWAVTTPEGFFDTGSIEDKPLFNWVMNDDPFQALPLEIFVRDYYQPHLLSRIFRGKAHELPRLPSLAGLNRIRPTIEGIEVKPHADDANVVDVTVKVASVPGQCRREGKQLPCESGLYDLRLYRDGQLVKQAPAVTETTTNLAGPDWRQQLQQWRQVSMVKKEGQPVTVATGPQEITFTNIQLPKRAGVSQVEFTAYAFNEDRVKSATSKPAVHPLPQPRPGTQRRAYLITVGVDVTSAGWRLRFARNGVTEIEGLLQKSLGDQQYQVVPVQLLSAYQKNSDEVLNLATKRNIQTVLQILSGREVSKADREQIPHQEQLQSATPDDLVVLYIASHGYVDPAGKFYVLPADIGPRLGVSEELLDRCLKNSEQSAQCDNGRRLLQHGIASEQLTQWLEAIDAGQMVLILDSCHSGAVTGPGFKPGPMGDRSFGQLSYDKGMLVLAAAQAEQLATGTLALRNRSLLTYALTQERTGPVVDLRQWLREAEQRVPLLYQQFVKAQSGSNESDQEPTLFDFVRHN